MPEFDLSPEQLGVVNSEGQRFIVTASAGAGKTSVLVARYLRHVVAEGLRPDQILAITFTRKAAAEMKDRIVRGLRESGLFEAAQIAETGPIQTIHSFCERLLRENALAAGLDPKFEIMSEGQASRLSNDCVREVLSSNLDEAPDAEELLSLLAGRRQPFRDSKSPYSLLEISVEKVLRELRSSGIPAESISEAHADPNVLARHWETSVVSRLPPAVRSAYPTVVGATFDQRIKNSFQSAGVKIPLWARPPLDESAEQESLRQTCGLVQVAIAAWWRLEAAMRRDQHLDFTALETRAVSLIRESISVRKRIAAQYAVVMVDEAQDVNPAQYELLNSLGIAREMLVGDVQQSIYGFRQADVDLFRKRTQEIDTLRLTKNHRSQPGILSFVDIVFEQVWAEEYARMNSPSVPLDLDSVVSIDCTGVELWRHSSRDSFATAEYVRELIDDGALPGEVTILVRDSAGAVDLKSRLDLEGIPSRIAGGSERFFTRMEVRDLANSLRATADPYDDYSLLACLRGPMAGLSVDALVLLGAESNVMDRLAGFASPVPDDTAKLRDFLAWFGPLCAYADRMAAWEVLAEIFARSPFLVTLARKHQASQLLANARKLLMLASDEPEMGPIEFADLISDIQDLRHKEGDAPAGAQDSNEVTLMTIHKAKGLEFHTVIVPQTDKPLVGKHKDLVVEPRLGLVATKFGRTPCLMHRFLNEIQLEREQREELRILYVALTRAKHRLCICTYPPKGIRTISKVIGDAIGSIPPPGVVVRNSKELKSEART